MSDAYADRAVAPEHLGIPVQGVDLGRLRLGHWYAASNLPGIYVSVMQPQAISAEILRSYPGLVNRLDSVEAARSATILRRSEWPSLRSGRCLSR